MMPNQTHSKRSQRASLDALTITRAASLRAQVWDRRSMTKPLCAIDTGGGVWKLKWRAGSTAESHSDNFVGACRAASAAAASDDELLLAACMYSGAGVYRCIHDSGAAGDAGAVVVPRWRIEAAAHYSGHGDGALVYGIEWLPASGAASAPDGVAADDLARSGAVGDSSSMSAAPSSALAHSRVVSCAFYNRAVHVWGAC